MGQLEELKLFIFARLHAVTNEILAAIEKSIAEYEDEVSRVKEENLRRILSFSPRYRRRKVGSSENGMALSSFAVIKTC